HAKRSLAPDRGVGGNHRTAGPHFSTHCENAGGRGGEKSMTIVNAMTVDVEDYFQVQAFAHRVDRSAWDDFPRRVDANVERLLLQFARAGVHATFFTLGWVAERHPAMVRRIVAAGHELASHGWDHTRADSQTREAFRADVTRTKALLEDIGGVPINGYRAATF